MKITTTEHHDLFAVVGIIITVNFKHGKISCRHMLITVVIKCIEGHIRVDCHIRGKLRLINAIPYNQWVDMLDSFLGFEGLAKLSCKLGVFSFKSLYWFSKISIRKKRF